jgi:hypothetical protein
MLKQTMLLAAITGVMTLASASVSAVEPVQAQTIQQTQEQVYGSQLMTKQERTEYRAKMRSLKTQDERDAFRLEHHKLMQERATAKGVTLPNMPAAGAGMNSGMKRGAGAGEGMGPGGGMGAGQGRQGR